MNKIQRTWATLKTIRIYFRVRRAQLILLKLRTKTLKNLVYGLKTRVIIQNEIKNGNPILPLHMQVPGLKEDFQSLEDIVEVLDTVATLLKIQSKKLIKIHKRTQQI